MINSNKEWFTEECTECGTAFSLEINKKLHDEQTAFQKIEVYSTKKFGNLMVIDGFVMLTDRDNFIYHEMMTHPVLFSHPNPQHVVIVGGGDCGSLREIAKHACVNKITQIEIDQRVTNIAEQYFPNLCEANNDPRTEFIFEDAIQWMDQASKDSIDVIIVDSTDPIGPAEGLISTPFYKNCLRVLKSDGLLVQQSESPFIHLESIIKPMHRSMLDAGFTNSKLINFPQPSYPTGWWTASIAYQANHLPFARHEQAQSLTFDTKYYNHAIHQASLSTPQFIQNNIATEHLTGRRMYI